MKKIFTLLTFVLLSTIASSQIINFPDPKFKNALVNQKCVDTDMDNNGDTDADTNNDGEIDQSEAEKVKYLDVSNNSITSIEGINFFKKLIKFNCYTNEITEINLTQLDDLEDLNVGYNQITNLKLSNFPSLKILACYFNKLENLNLSNLPKIQRIIGQNNNLSSYDISNLPSLEGLSLVNNQLKNLVVSNHQNISTIECANNLLDSLILKKMPKLANLTCGSNNNFTSLDISNLPQFEYFDAYYSSNLKKINFSNLPRLATIYCYYGKIESLEFNKVPSLSGIYCSGNLLKKLVLENMPNLNNISCSENPLMTELNIQNGDEDGYFEYLGPDNLEFICCEQNKIEYFKKKHPKAEISTFCPFAPAGGKFFSTSGSVLYDTNKDGCKTNSLPMKYFKIIASNETGKGAIYTDELGQYTFRSQAGNLMMAIDSSFLKGFTSMPIFISLDSKSDSMLNPICISPKGFYRQIDITILPLSPPARPGFNTDYKIVITNRGNQKESGTLNFRYNEDLLDYVKADVNPSLTSNGLVSWDFNNFLPLESRNYTVTLEVNRPTDNPSVNAGDVLIMSASIVDNFFILKNTVVGSYDPNDKTCLEGDKITLDMIDKYVNYLIRFENTGTFAAENVVVKDVIDNTKFDISTLQVSDASHRVRTRIIDNIVEFIFDKIDLPFDDANNDGYVAFKIKTRPTLVLGDELKNKASIYFDYNFPIQTNETKTVIANSVNTLDTYSTMDVTLFPNPVQDVLKFYTSENILKVEIFDLNGRLLQIRSVTNNEVNIDSLSRGTYLLKIYNKLGSCNGKMVKM
jgi:uncharacterized repeat protein (TIGR01451 family)